METGDDRYRGNFQRDNSLKAEEIEEKKNYIHSRKAYEKHLSNFAKYVCLLDEKKKPHRLDKTTWCTLELTGISNLPRFSVTTCARN